MHARIKTNRIIKPPAKFIGAYVATDIKKKLVARARVMDRSVAWLVEKLLADGLERLEQTDTHRARHVRLNCRP